MASIVQTELKLSDIKTAAHYSLSLKPVCVFVLKVYLFLVHLLELIRLTLKGVFLSVLSRRSLQHLNRTYFSSRGLFCLTNIGHICKSASNAAHSRQTRFEPLLVQKWALFASTKNDALNGLLVPRLFSHLWTSYQSLIVIANLFNASLSPLGTLILIFSLFIYRIEIQLLSIGLDGIPSIFLTLSGDDLSLLPTRRFTLSLHQR